ncbi:MAG: bifunctional (p)ppGpp synthetase/guanosine-3',5'-bis(diphosphate) 3'-pyrophosphohydrolase, partial [Bacilli bacterium]|nr:bifunctional (p)ppGpp synthetase/guanosine-3',5'-bis(diphosphate) 3'-pyrophosphohydrolase [Bacilli bacterium]
MAEKANPTYPPNGGYPMHSFEDLKGVFYLYITNPKDRKMVEDAYEFAKAKHQGQKRKSGEEYIHHPIEVAYILAELQSGPATLAAGFLHDVVEDTDATIQDIEDGFGEEVAKIVDALTKIQRLKLSKRTESDFEAEDHRKIFLGMAKDVRVILVKLADRLHNLRTLRSLSPERRKGLARETLDVFTPIAHRLGIYKIQSEMEDLCLKYLYPEIYEEILEKENQRTKYRQASLENLKKRIADILFEKNVPFRMESRVKSVYSLYRKMYLHGRDFDDIYDLMAIRIITQTEMNCYEILGIIHQTYKPIPGRFKDYIAMPKP